MADIKVYTTQMCPWCHKLTEFLKAKGIEFEEIDVSENQQAAQEMIKKSGHMGVPQIEINGKIIVGFNQPAIEAELAKLGKAGEEKKEAA